MLLRRPLSEKWTAEHRTRARTLFAGGTWPQQGILKAGRATTGQCQACMNAVGTDLHRTHVCSARDVMRRRVGGRHVQQRGANPFPGFESLWAR
eukprot:9261512-Pyramimonas_sp.AAC.1